MESRHRLVRRRRFAGLATAVLVALGAGTVAITLTATADAATVGAGSYTETLPAGAKLPTGCGDLATNPRQFLTANAPPGAVPTNDWWSSLVFKKGDECNFSQPLFAHPAAYRPVASGLGLSYQTDAAISGSGTGVGEYHYPYAQHVVVGVAGLNAPRALVDGWSDWTVTPSWSDGARTMKATIGHGLPMSYYQVTGGDALISVVGPPTAGRTAATGSAGRSAATTTSRTARPAPPGRSAATPSGPPWPDADTSRSPCCRRRRHQHGRQDRPRRPVRPGTRTTTSPAPGCRTRTTRPAGTVNTTYAFTTTAREGSGTGTVIALYPHQWRYLVRRLAARARPTSRRAAR